MPSPNSVFLRRLSIGASVFALALTGCAGGGGSSSSSTGTTSGSTAIAPLAIATVSPTNVPVGSGDITLVVAGTGFTSSSVVVLNGVSEPTTFTSSTELRAAVAAAQMKTGNVLSVSVSNGSTTVKADPAVTALSVDNPVPSLASVSPGSVLLGASDTTVTVTGTNFVQGVALAVNGTTRTTTYVSDTQLTAQLSASDFAGAGSLPLNVINPKPGGGTSGTSALAVNNPQPAISAVSPASVAAGSGDTAVTLTGTGLLPGTVLQVNGANHAATVASGTKLTFTLTASELASAKSLQLTLTNALPGGGTSTAVALAVQNPLPTVASVSPSSLSVGSGATTLTLSGTGFVQGSTVLVNGGARTSQYISGTSIGVTLNANDVAATGTLSVAVANPQPGGGTSATTSVAVNNPVPTLASLTPSAIAKGSGDTTIALAGSGFLPTTTLQINGTAHPVTYVNSTVLSVTFVASELVNSTSYAITATNPAPGGGTSPAVVLTVGSGSPVITALSPNALPVGSAATNVTITGTGFVPNSQVLFGGYQHSGVTYVSSTQLTLPLTASDLAYYGTYSVVISNPSTAGGVSPAATFTVQAKTPVITSVTPSSIVANSGATTLVVSGTNLQYNSQVLWNGTALPTSYYSSSYNYTTGTYNYVLYASVSADLVASNGSASITVMTPTSASASNAVTVAITDPPVPTISGISPNVVPSNTSTKLTVSGAGYTKKSVVNYNGTALTTTFGSSSSLSATIPASLTAFPGNGNVTVTTPAPGGGTSSAAMLTIYVPVVSNSMVYNPVNGLAYLSIPSTGSTVAGNSIVSIDPATGALGTPIYVGSEPGVMAISDDGKTLWVALNGTTAIRKVDLVNATAGAQYSVAALGTSGNAVSAILVMPGTTDSVAVAMPYTLGIFDSGVLRGSTVNVSSVYALQADATRKEIYAGGYSLQAYTYTSSGLSLKSSGNSSSYNVTSSTFDEMQLASGKMFTDFGRVYDPESGALLGTLQQGTTTLNGPALYDAALSQLYVLSNSSGSYYNGYSQIALFNPSDYSNTGKTIAWNIPYSITNTAGNYVYLNPHRLTRWGANGLMVHTSQAFFTMQSNTVKDQSSISADLVATVSAQGGGTTGSSTTYTVTVKNNGPQAATDVALSLQAPSTGILTSATASAGACSSVTGCTLGTIASGASVTVTAQALQTTSGTGTLTATASGSSNDPDFTNNAATASTTVTGATYNLPPSLTAISPASIKAGAQDTTLTVTGTNFTSNSTVMLGSTSLTTTYVNSGKLTATVPASSLAGMNWYAVTVSVPAPGGGSSGSLPLTVYNVVTVGLNHIVYEPYSRKLYASVSTGSSTVTANSVVGIDPLTGTFDTPFTFSTVPNLLALSTSGSTLYTDLAPPSTASSGTITTLPFGRLNLLTGTSDNVTAQLAGSYNYTYSYSASNGFALQPGSENVLAMSRYYGYLSLYDYNTTNKTLVPRGTASTNWTYSTCLNFLDSSNLLFFNSTAVDYPVTSSGLGNPTTLSSSSDCLRTAGSVAASILGKVYKVSSTALTQVGSLVLPSTYNSGSSGNLPPVALDPSLQSVFYASNSSSTSYAYTDGLVSYNLSNYLRTGALNLNIPTTEGSSYSYSINDVIRWGQDGLALVTSTGHLYLLRGPFVVPGELGTGSAATLSSSSSSTITRGSGNTLLTLTGTNFQPGVAVTWNGSYRTTTIVDATHVTVAVPSTDLASAGSANLVATNPGASASNTLAITVQ